MAPAVPTDGGREVGRSSENFGAVRVATLKAVHEEAPDDQRTGDSFPSCLRRLDDIIDDMVGPTTRRLMELYVENRRGTASPKATH